MLQAIKLQAECPPGDQGTGSLPLVRYQIELTPGSCNTSVEAMNCFAAEHVPLAGTISPLAVQSVHTDALGFNALMKCFV